MLADSSRITAVSTSAHGSGLVWSQQPGGYLPGSPITTAPEPNSSRLTPSIISQVTRRASPASAAAARDAECIEGALLCDFISARRLLILLLQHAVAPFMCTIVLRLTRARSLEGNSELQEQRRESRQSENRHRSCERHTVVGVNDIGQSILSERLFKRPTRRLDRCALKPLADQQIRAVRIADRERITEHTVAEPELPLEVRRSHTIRLVRLRAGRSPRCMWWASAMLANQTVTLENLADRTRIRPGGLRSLANEPGVKCDRARAWILPARFDYACYDLRICGIGVSMRRPSSAFAPRRTFTVVPLNTLVARLPTDTIAVTTLRNRETAIESIHNKPRTLLHTVSLTSRHRAPLHKGMP